MSARGLRKENEKKRKKENPREKIKDRGEGRTGKGVKCMVEVNGGKYEKRGRN